MGKQSRRKREKDEGLAFANDYLRRAGLPTRPEGGAYRRLLAADPEWDRRFRETEDATPARYALLYRDLDTALAEYAARAVAIAQPWLRWWSAHHPPATRLLDAGCGPGVLTCAYALALPDTEVVGLDAVPEAVACARELARRLGVGNVSFCTGDLSAPGADAAGGGFDQLVAVTALGDGGVYPQDLEGGDPFSSVAEIEGPAQQFNAPALPALVDRLVPGGHALVFDRTPYAVQAMWLASALVHAGIELDLSAAGAESIMEDGETRTFTRLTGRRGGPPAGSTAGLAAWLEAVAPPAYGTVWHDELRFEKFKAAGAERVWAVEITYAPYSPAVERHEVWALGADAYAWVTTSLQLRQFSRGRTVDALIAEHSAYARKLAAKGIRVRASTETPEL